MTAAELGEGHAVDDLFECLVDHARLRIAGHVEGGILLAFGIETGLDALVCLTRGQFFAADPRNRA